MEAMSSRTRKATRTLSFDGDDLVSPTPHHESQHTDLRPPPLQRVVRSRSCYLQAELQATGQEVESGGTDMCCELAALNSVFAFSFARKYDALLARYWAVRVGRRTRTSP